MKIEPFAMERMQSTYENEVELNLSESGVHPMRLSELLEDDGSREALLEQQLVYPQSNGTVALREAISAMYPGAGVDHVEVTNGGSEANFVSVWTLVEPGDEVVLMVPNYMQTYGLARGFGGLVREWPLKEIGGRWRVDLAHLETLVGSRTRLIIICNPNNPTGARLEAPELDGIARIAARHGSWILSDEIYRGAELDGVEAPSMWGRYDRLVITSGLSKAYGLPGLRIGWLVAPPDFVLSCWSRHDYTTISAGTLSDRLATVALEPERRKRILSRTRAILLQNLPLISEWLAAQPSRFSFVPPEAGAIVYTRYKAAINSTELVTRLRETRSVLIVPGDHFGMDGYLRIGFGPESGYLLEGLSRLKELLESLPEDQHGRVVV
jgi:aspartate/methionine/tyrosine aminotransferase